MHPQDSLIEQDKSEKSFLAQTGDIGQALLDAGYSLENAQEAYDRFYGRFDSLEEFCHELITELHPAFPEKILFYIDAHTLVRDLEFSGWDVIIRHHAVFAFASCSPSHTRDLLGA